MARRKYHRVQVIRSGNDLPHGQRPGFRREDVMPEVPPMPDNNETRQIPEAEQTLPPRVIDRTNVDDPNLEPHVGEAVKVLEKKVAEDEKRKAKPVKKAELVKKADVKPRKAAKKAK